MSRFHNLTVSDVRQETRDTVSIAFSVPAEMQDEFRYHAGQHLALRTRIDGEEVMRTYSICTAEQDGELRVAIKRQPHGRFSNFANEQFRAGDSIEVMPPQGHFGLKFDAENRRNYLAVAAGSGITPIISMIKTGLEAEPRSTFTLIYGNRSTQNMIFREQLEDLKNMYMERFTLIPVMSREQTDIELFHGHIDDEKCRELFRYWLDPSDLDECVICGPESMVHSVTDALKDAGLAQESIHFELFTAPGEAQERRRQRQDDITLDHSAARVVVRVDGGQVEFDLPRNTQSILDAGMEAGADLPFSCKGGVCSTCRARVVEGEVEMDVNYALEDYEIEAGYVLTCQSFPVSEKVVLDYDA